MWWVQIERLLSSATASLLRSTLSAKSRMISPRLELERRLLFGTRPPRHRIHFSSTHNLYVCLFPIFIQICQMIASSLSLLACLNFDFPCFHQMSQASWWSYLALGG
jgi:hypothetical protein